MDNVKSLKLVTENDFGDTLETPFFRLTYTDQRTSVVPCIPENRDFQDIRDWYETQSQKPFAFDFDEYFPPEPVNQEVIHIPIEEQE